MMSLKRMLCMCGYMIYVNTYVLFDIDVNKKNVKKRFRTSLKLVTMSLTFKVKFVMKVQMFV